MSGQATERDDTFVLSSGITLSLRRSINVHLLTDLSDCQQIERLLTQKITEIEFQLELHRKGLHSDGSPFSAERPSRQDWESRAIKAKAWTTVQRDQVARRAEQLTKAQSPKTESIKDEFIALAQVALGADLSEQLWEQAKARHNHSPSASKEAAE